MNESARQDLPHRLFSRMKATARGLTMRMALRTVLLGASIVLLSSCSFFEEPEPYVNMNAVRTQVKDYANTNLASGGVYCGGLFVLFTPEENEAQVNSVRMYVDTVEITERVGSQYEYFMDTKSFGDGLHQVTFNVFQFDPQGGLPNLLNPPRTVYLTTIDIGQRELPPAPGSATHHWIKFNHPQVLWSYNLADTVSLHFFVIQRVAPSRFTDTVYDTGARLYIDTSIVCGIENTVRYKIGAGNSSGVNYATCIPR